MGRILDIDDPLWKILNDPHRPYGDPVAEFTKIQIEVHQTFVIRNGQDYCDLFQSMFDFIESDGWDEPVHAELDYHTHVQRAQRMVSVHRVVFHFKEPRAAFAFKMRFG